MHSSPSRTFDLIKTLEPTEKAYIKKKFSANEKNLKQLFDDLNKTKTYNSEQFKKKHKTKTYINHLSQNKTYLHKKIIDALIQYNAKSIPQISQRKQLNTINILINKGLLNQAVKLIELCLQENEPIENYIQCYELCSLITNLSVSNVSYVLPQEVLNAFKQKRRFYIRQLSLIEKFAEFADIHYAQINSSEKITLLQQKFKTYELENTDDLPKDYPFFTKRIFYFSKYMLTQLQNHSKAKTHLLKKSIDLYYMYPVLLKLNYAPFLTDSVNYLGELIGNNLFDQFFEFYNKVIDKIDEINRSTVKNDFATSIFVIRYFFFQIACTNSKQHQKANIFSEKYLTFIKNKKNLSDQFLSASRVSIAVAQLNIQQFEEAIDIINPIQNTKFYQYQYELRLVQIIAHYRLGNDLVLDSLFTSFIYYLKKQEKLEQTKAIRTLKKCMEKQNFGALKNVEFDELDSLNVQFSLTTTLVPE